MALDEDTTEMDDSNSVKSIKRDNFMVIDMHLELAKKSLKSEIGEILLKATTTAIVNMTSSLSSTPLTHIKVKAPSTQTKRQEQRGMLKMMLIVFTRFIQLSNQRTFSRF